MTPPAQLFPTPDTTALICVDIQERLVPAMSDPTRLCRYATILMEAANILQLPLFTTEQYPQGLGSTLPELVKYLDPARLWAKTSFSCFGVDAFADALSACGRPHVAIFGIETHVCVQSTALDALAKGYQVTLLADAVDSRADANRQLSLQLLRDAGAVVTSTEAFLFALVKDAKSQHFKAVSKLIK